MSLQQRSKELAPLAWEPVQHEAIPGLSVRYISPDAAYLEWLRGKAGEGFRAVDDQISYLEAKQ